MVKDKVHGLVPNKYLCQGRELRSGGLVNSILHHVDGRKLRMIVRFCVSKGDTEELMEYRGRMLEIDMHTLEVALQEILKIAKKKGYEDIRQILEEREYEHGHDFLEKDHKNLRYSVRHL